jgi:hypothetical protein
VTEQTDEQRSLFLELGQNRRLAHHVLFQHRHPLATPSFHYRIIDAFHGPHPQVVIEGFRDSAKSTRAEEALVIGSLWRDFRNAVVIGASYPRAKERLTAIKNEFVVNPYINQLFGSMEGPTWGEGRIVLNNGVCLTALGSGMSMRGTKYLDARPDFVLVDDLEDEESVRTPEAREQMMHWLYRTLVPALNKGAAGTVNYRIRFLGNRLDSDAVIVRISKDAAWRHLRFPVMGQEDTPEAQERYDLPPGRWVPLWPEKFSLEDIARKRAEYERQGLLHDFNCEYMCEAEDFGSRLFTDGQARTVAHTRTWEAVYAAYDPARTVGTRSAMTGKAVFSWINNRLVIWEGDAQLWMPDQIVDDILTTDDTWSPVELGVEATGLEEFIMQPLRHRALQRRQLLPLRRLVPPRGKDSFIRGLQPFFKAGEVEFVNVTAEARGQLLAFPTGRKDFPNALAYALMLRPGLPVYDGFSRAHVKDTIPRTRQPWWLAVQATAQYTAAVLLQVVDGGVFIHADWVREGPPGEVLADVVGVANLEAAAVCRVVVPPIGVGAVDTVGLRVAGRASQLQLRNGGDVVRGRQAVRELLGKRRREEPQLQVAAGARWTLNAFAGGYAVAMNKRGQAEREPVDGPYKVVMEALESFVAVMSVVSDADPDLDNKRYAVAADGRRYITIRAEG